MGRTGCTRIPDTAGPSRRARTARYRRGSTAYRSLAGAAAATWRPLGVARPAHTELRHPRLERRRLQSEPLGGAAHAAHPPRRALEHAPDVFLLDVDQP